MGEVASLGRAPDDTLWAVVASVGKTHRVAEVYANRRAALADRTWREQQVRAYEAFLRNARRPEFDLDGAEPLWRIPGERMKMRRKNPGEHLVPLSTQVVALLRKLRTITWDKLHGLLFPGLVPGKPISDATLGQALRRLGYGPDRIVPHGFRAMASTALNEQGHAPDLIELQLAHRDSSVRAIYNRSTRLPERRTMMQSWSDYLDALRTGANVVLFRRPGGA